MDPVVNIVTERVMKSLSKHPDRYNDFTVNHQC